MGLLDLFFSFLYLPSELDCFQGLLVALSSRDLERKFPLILHKEKMGIKCVHRCVVVKCGSGYEDIVARHGHTFFTELAFNSGGFLPAGVWEIEQSAETQGRAYSFNFGIPGAGYQFEFNRAAIGRRSQIDIGRHPIFDFWPSRFAQEFDPG